MTVSVFCNRCVPAGGVEDYTVGFIGTPKCDRCGCECGPDNLHVGSLRHLWPRPKLVSEEKPDLDERVLVRQPDNREWYEATYRQGVSGIHFEVDGQIVQPVYWLPMPSTEL